MCITEIWTYRECGCHYLHPIPCYDHVLQSPSKPYGKFVNSAQVSHSPSSSVSSLLSKEAIADAKDFTRASSSSQSDTSGSEDNTEATYDHRLHLVRTCSLRQTIHKTFLEPICDDCLLLELGLAPETSSSNSTHGENDHDERNLEGADWLLESRVEITVEPAVGDDDDFSQQSLRMTLSSSSDSENEDETPRRSRGRARRRAMELTRESLPMNEGLPTKRRCSFPKFKQPSQHLRRARKQADLKSSSTTPLQSDPSKSSSSSSSTTTTTRPPSWIEHLKSDLGHRVRRKHRHDLTAESDSEPSSSTPDAEHSGAANEDRLILSLPSIPATASSTSSISFEESVLVPLDQIISSAEFEHSFLSQHSRPRDIDSGSRRLKQGDAEERRISTQSLASLVRSERSFYRAVSTVSGESGLVATANEGGDPGGCRGKGGVGVGISLHPLSCPVSRGEGAWWEDA